jgi:hypothetical protein
LAFFILTVNSRKIKKIRETPMLFLCNSRRAEISALGFILTVSACSAFAQDHFNAKGVGTKWLYFAVTE